MKNPFKSTVKFFSKKSLRDFCVQYYDGYYYLSDGHHIVVKLPEQYYMEVFHAKNPDRFLVVPEGRESLCNGNYDTRDYSVFFDDVPEVPCVKTDYMRNKDGTTTQVFLSWHGYYSPVEILVNKEFSDAVDFIDVFNSSGSPNRPIYGYLMEHAVQCCICPISNESAYDNGEHIKALAKIDSLSVKEV